MEGHGGGIAFGALDATVVQPRLRRRRYRVEGTVPRVGFRPWVHGPRPAARPPGFSLNDGHGVVLEDDARLIAAAVQEGLAAASADACLDAGGAGGVRVVVLTGGCLQDARLAASLRARLEGYDYVVLTPSRVPAGDGGISYGQAAIAAARTG